MTNMPMPMTFPTTNAVDMPSPSARPPAAGSAAVAVAGAAKRTLAGSALTDVVPTAGALGWMASMLHQRFLQRHLDQGERLIDVCPGYHQRRDEAHGADSAREQQQAIVIGAGQEPLAQGGVGPSGVRIGDELHADHEAAAAYIADTGKPLLQLAQPAQEVLPDLRCIVRIFALDQIERGEGSGTAQGGAPVRVAMGTAPPFLHERSPCHDQSDGQTGAQPLGECHDVGVHAPMLAREHPPRASDARLHLIEDEQNAVAVAQRAQPLEESLWWNQVATLALDGLHEDRRHFLRR